jgi:hypothetical protein
MAKKKKAAKAKMGGPFLAAAIYCHNILEDLRGMLTIQGITDTLHIKLGPLAPESMPSKEHPVVINHQLLLIFRSGDAPGKYRLRLVIEGPSGKRMNAINEPITLSDPPHGGATVKTAATLSVGGGGLYLIDVFLNSKLMTRMPINIAIERDQVNPGMVPKKA